MKEFLRIFAVLLVIAVIFGLGYLVGKNSIRNNYKERDMVMMEVMDEFKSPEKKDLKDKIDSLDMIIEELKDTEVRIDTVRVIELQQISKLPLDSATNYLREKLEEYENKLSTVDP